MDGIKQTSVTCASCQSHDICTTNLHIERRTHAGGCQRRGTWQSGRESTTHATHAQPVWLGRGTPVRSFAATSLVSLFRRGEGERERPLLPCGRFRSQPRQKRHAKFSGAGARARARGLRGVPLASQFLPLWLLSRSGTNACDLILSFPTCWFLVHRSQEPWHPRFPLLRRQLPSHPQRCCVMGMWHSLPRGSR